MARRFFLAYLVIEMAVIIALVATIGLGWTLLALVAAFVIGLLLAGAQLRRQLAALTRGMRDPAAGMTDSLLVALGSVLVVMPGLVSSVAGLLMLIPATRGLLRPAAGGLAARAVNRRLVFVDLTGDRRPGYAGRTEYIDGEVIDVADPAPVADLPAVRHRAE